MAQWIPKARLYPLAALILLAFSFGWESRAFIGGPPVLTMPRNCAELLPDPTPFTRYFETVAKGAVNSDQALSRRLFRILALRDELNSSHHINQSSNPVDGLIRKTLCYYRSQREPINAIPYDNPPFVKFLKGSLKELEKKVEEAIMEAELLAAQRTAYETRLNQNRRLIERVKRQATAEADRSYRKYSASAKRKVKKD